MRAAKHLESILRISLPAVLILSLAAVPLPASAEEESGKVDISGEWEMKVDFNGRDTFATLTITKKDDGSLAGKWGASDLSDVKFDGKKLTFVRTLRFGDQEFSMNFEGTLKDGGLQGALSSDQGALTASAVRRKPKSPALGRWDLGFTVGEREITAVLAVTQKTDGALEAKWTSGTGEHSVSNVKFQDGKLSFARHSKIGEREFDSTFEGKVQGHELAGTIKSERGDIEAKGKRVGADLVGNWELTSTSERGPRTNTLMVFGDLTGRYEFFGGEIPIQEIQLDGGQVAFTVEMNFGDQPFTLKFKGKLDGKTLKGEMESPRGTREVTGKKLAPSA